MPSPDKDFLLNLFRDAGGTAAEYAEFCKNGKKGQRCASEPAEPLTAASPKNEGKETNAMDKKKIIEQLRAMFGGVESLKAVLDAGIAAIEKDDATETLVATIQQGLSAAKALADQAKELADLKAKQTASEDLAAAVAALRADVQATKTENQNLLSQVTTLKEDKQTLARQNEEARVKTALAVYTKVLPTPAMAILSKFCLAPQALSPQTFTLPMADGKTADVALTTIAMFQEFLGSFPEGFFTSNLTAQTETKMVPREEALKQVEEQTAAFERRLSKSSKSPADKKKAVDEYRAQQEAKFASQSN